MPSSGWQRRAFLDSVSIAVLFTLAVAQPALDLLRLHPEFFVARHSEPLDIVLLPILLCFLLPLTLIAILLVLSGLHQRLSIIFHNLLFLLLGALMLIPLFKRAGYLSGSIYVPLSVCIACGFLLIYRKQERARSLLAWLGLLIFVIPATFLMSGPIRDLLSTEERSSRAVQKGLPVPVVFLLLDELPLVSLLNSRQEIDAERFPNFARFQQDALWFRNATTVADGTPEAVAAILSGLYPSSNRLPILKHYPNNLFTLLADSHEINAMEHVSKMSPGGTALAGSQKDSSGERMKLTMLDLSAIYLHIVTPHELRSSLPAIHHTWGNFWEIGIPADKRKKFSRLYSARPEQFQAFLKSIVPSPDPALYFQHILLPHVPWSFLPSGKEYDHSGYGPMGVEGMSVHDEVWTSDEWVVNRGYQRHLLQVCYVDRMIGMLVDRLREQNLYDSSMIVITADHGSSYRASDRVRSLTSTNLADVVSVPVLIKLPGMKEGRLVDHNFETIDILPTIADALEMEMPFPTDGRSALSNDAPRTQKRVLKTIFTRDEWIDLPTNVEIERAASVERKIRMFGTGDPQLLYDRMNIPAGFPSKPEETRWSEGDGVRFELKNPAAFQKVDLQSNFIPVFVVGRALFKFAPSKPVVIGVWINGDFRGITRTFAPDTNVTGWLRTLWLRSSTGSNTARLEDIHGFGIIVSESSFRQGNNDVRIRVLDPSVYKR